jgi:hypothetical protein
VRNIYWISGVIGALAIVSVGSDATAFSISPVARPKPDVMLIAGGCGIGYHRGPYGGCLPNVGYPAVGYGGVYRGGVYRGGVYRGGVYHGGAYRGGVYRGGVYRGGAYRGGAYRGGGYHRGGVYRR